MKLAWNLLRALPLLLLLQGCVIRLGSSDAGAPNDTNDTNDTGSTGVDAAKPITDEAIQGTWKNATANLANMASECGNLSDLSVKPNEDMLIVSVARKGLWASTDGGQSWHALGSDPSSAVITNRGTSLVYDPSKNDRFWQSGIYNGDGVYTTNDDGLTFKSLGDVAHSDLIAVDFGDPERKVLLIGGHETAHALLRSDDGGTTWNSIGAGLPDNVSCTFPFIIDARTYLVGCSYTGEGIYRSTDAGKSWTQVSSVGGSDAPLQASDGSIFWALKDDRGLVRSTDAGNTWSQVVDTGVVRTVTPLELPDGRIAMFGHGGVVVSADSGKTWKTVTAALPYQDANGLAYSKPQRAFFAKHNTCDPTFVPVDAIMRYDYDYATSQ